MIQLLSLLSDSYSDSYLDPEEVHQVPSKRLRMRCKKEFRRVRNMYVSSIPLKHLAHAHLLDRFLLLTFLYLWWRHS